MRTPLPCGRVDVSRETSARDIQVREIRVAGLIADWSSTAGYSFPSESSVRDPWQTVGTTLSQRSQIVQDADTSARTLRDIGDR